MDPNLIIDDSYVLTVGESSKTRGDALEGIMDNFVSILEATNTDGFIEGATATALRDFISCVKLLNDKLQEVSEQVNLVCQSFLQEINEADSYLF